MENLTSEKVKLIELAALKGEREVFKDMGYVCEKNKEKAKEWWLRGAKLGHVDCMLLYAQQNPLRSIVRWKWFCKAAALGNSNGFFEDFYTTNIVRICSPVIYCIGKCFKNNYNALNNTTFNENQDRRPHRIHDLNKVIAFYDKLKRPRKLCLNLDYAVYGLKDFTRMCACCFVNIFGEHAKKGIIKMKRLI